MKTDAGVSSNQRSRARAMRGAPTDSELRLWRLLRDRTDSSFADRFRSDCTLSTFFALALSWSSKPTDRNTPKVLATRPVTLIWRTKAGRCFASGTTRCCRIAKGFWRQFTRMQADPHPALRATFSPREKGRSTPPFPVGQGWAERQCRSPFPSGGRWRAEGVTDEGCAN
jgi:hypothetical protein